MNQSEIAIAPMHRLCKNAGADRVSEAAAKQLAKALEDIGVKIAKEALDYAICMLEEKPLKRKILKSRLEKSQEDCSSTIIRRLHLRLSLGVQINPQLFNLFFIEFQKKYKMKSKRIA